MNVLIIPEDFPKDQHVLRPIIQAMLEHLGKKQARVRVCTDPRLQGIGEAMKWSRVEEILSRYRGMVDLFLLCVDRDGLERRRASLDHLETQGKELLPEHKCFLAENAWQEIEVWLLAGHDLPTEWSWDEIRGEIHPKERYYLSLAQSRGVMDQPAEGRKVLAEEAARRYTRIRQLCKEDVLSLEERVGAWIRGTE